MRNLDTLFAQLKRLDAAELKVIADTILSQLKSDEYTRESRSSGECICRKCGGKDCLSKYGKDRNGKQRYRCKQCGATFTDTSFSVISHSHCSISTWEKYIECMLQGLSLHKCAQTCQISVQTAFLWRHKILSVLQRDQNDRMLGGIVELDEAFFSISYKGNHSKSKTFVMPRKAYKRGTDNKAQTGSRACVMCALERNGQIYAEVLGKGQPTIAMLSHAFDNRILNDTIVLSDGAVGARHYFENIEQIQHITLAAVANPKKKSGPPEVRGAFHIQNANNMHARLRKFLSTYNGISTKYLNHYVNLFVWLDNHKKIQQIDFKSEITKLINKCDTYVKAQSLLDLPAIPCVA